MGTFARHNVRPVCTRVQVCGSLRRLEVRRVFRKRVKRRSHTRTVLHISGARNKNAAAAAAAQRDARKQLVCAAAQRRR